MRAQLALILLVAACGGTDTPTTATIPIEAPPEPVVAAPPTTPGAPLTPGAQFEWVMQSITNGTTEADVTAHFHPKFLAAVPADQIVAVLGDLKRQLGEFSIVSKADPDPNHVLVIIQGKTARIRATLGTDPTTGQIDALLFQPDAADKPKTFEEATTMAQKLAPKASLLVAKLDQGTCKPIHALDTKAELAIGSTFKLYVLLGLADQIAGKKLAWEQELAVRDDWKSLPSGVTQDDAAGTKLTIKTLAERMISISDNTATDHLLFTVGRDKVEAALKTAKHAKPALNTPFMATRDLMILKLGATEEDRERYVKANAAARRKLLASLAAKPLPDISAADGWTTGRHIEDIEWFASGDDLCRVMGQLWTRAQKPVNAPVLEVMGKNPGVPLDPAVWPYIAFKGGSEPGVLNLTWLLRRADDQWFVVSAGFNAPEAAVDDTVAVGIASGLIDFAAAAK